MRIDRMKLDLAMAKKLMNQKALAEKSKLSRQTLSYVMNGKSCNADSLLRIAEALEVEPENLIEN